MNCKELVNVTRPVDRVVTLIFLFILYLLKTGVRTITDKPFLSVYLLCSSFSSFGVRYHPLSLRQKIKQVYSRVLELNVILNPNNSSV